MIFKLEELSLTMQKMNNCHLFFSCTNTANQALLKHVHVEEFIVSYEAFTSDVKL